MRIPVLLSLSLTLSLTLLVVSGCQEQKATVSCAKQEAGICTEYEDVTAEQRERLAKGQCIGATLSDARCPTKELAGTCKNQLLLDKQIQTTALYYRPIKPPHTEETLQKLCSTMKGTWTPP